MDKKIENKTCRQCHTSFDITQKDLDFYNKVSPVFGGEKYQIPTPTLCPKCRHQRRLVWRNERNLYKRKCNATGKSIVSMFSPDKNLQVYHYKTWWQDESFRDNIPYLKVDLQEKLFPQFGELIKKVPHINLYIHHDNENCEYSNLEGASKNGYMVFGGAENQDFYYISHGFHSQDCIDGEWVLHSSQNYESLDVSQLHNCSYLQSSENCDSCHYGKNLKGCKKCIGCVNLEGKKFYIFNVAYTEQEYLSKAQELLAKRGQLQKMYQDFLISQPQKANQNTLTENCYGDYLSECNNCYQCFLSLYLEDSRYCSVVGFAESCFDVSNGGLVQFAYESLNVGAYTTDGKSSHVYFSVHSLESSHIFYCYNCMQCSDCFLCAGLKNKRYCILNKQYTKEQYDNLVSQILTKMQETKEWGEFFPLTLSLFGYNETTAQEYFPLSKEDTLQKGWPWSDYKNPSPRVDKIIPANKLPENINSIPDDILNWAINCEVTQKPFRIIEQELDFYRKHQLPIPKKHPDQRHVERLNLRNPQEFFLRKCDKCTKELHTTYSPERPEIVYCENCYNKEIYG